MKTSLLLAHDASDKYPLCKTLDLGVLRYVVYPYPSLGLIVLGSFAVACGDSNLLHVQIVSVLYLTVTAAQGRRRRSISCYLHRLYVP